jgi:ribonuclease PH
LDLDYLEDSKADTDMNVVVCEPDTFIELQGTAERSSFDLKDLNALLVLAQKGASALFSFQKKALDL